VPAALHVPASMIAISLSVLFCLWVIFLGGASRIENTLAGFFEFGLVGSSASAIRVLAWVYLLLAGFFIIIGAF
jgi:hypothetical protein